MWHLIWFLTPAVIDLPELVLGVASVGRQPFHIAEILNFALWRTVLL